MIVVPSHVYSDPLWEGPLGLPPWVQTRWDIICYVYVPPKEEGCPGEGRCHGCLGWCVWCGVVNEVCDVEWPHVCDTHKRYPAQPEPPKPDPNQLWLPGVMV